MRHFIVTALLFSAIIAISANAKPHDLHPPHEAGFTPLGAELPRIKGIAPEIFANASKEAQIRALQIEDKSRNELHKATQRFRDEREKLELDKRILQVKLYHAQGDEKQNLLNQLYNIEQSITTNRLNERNLRDKEELKTNEKIYNELRK
ncbi:hypothetical protein [Helicobacter sp. T3_23-1059]